MKLAINALIKYIVGLLLSGGLLFSSAGVFDYWKAWLFIGILFGPMLVLGITMFFRSKPLLEKRLNSKEKESTQKGVVALSGVLFITGFVLAGLDHRFGWSQVPLWAVILASFIFLIAFGFYAEVMRENDFLSRTIETYEGQRVVDTGLYSIVRHPMYASSIWMFMSIPFILGSWWSLICFVPYIGVIIVRIHNEEKVLEKGLPSYIEYKRRIKYRLFPYIW